MLQLAQLALYVTDMGGLEPGFSREPYQRTENQRDFG